MDQAVIKLESDHHIFKLEYDCDVQNPRTEFDNLTHFCIDNKYATGECQDKVNDALRKVAKALGFSVYGKSNDELIEALLKSKNKQIGRYIEIQPLYVYDHSGVTYSISPFNCRWDSGMVGYCFTTRYDFIEMGLEEKFNSESALKYIKSEVEYWDHYAQGNTFLFSLENKNGENIECIGGFIGHYDDVTKEIINDYLTDYPDIVALKNTI